MKLIFDLQGRFGNHFFIISAMIYAIKKYNVECKIYIPDYVLGYHNDVKLSLSYIYNSLNEFRIYEIPNNVLYSADLNCYNLDGELNLDKLINDNINTDNTILLAGEYFQDKKYFLKHKNDIKKIFNINSNKINIYKENISNNDVFISVRRGDFIDVKFYVLNENYYIDNYNKYFHGKNIYISCDDIEWCKKNLTVNKFNECKNIIYIENYTPIEIFLLSQYFSNYICSNSTFSWACELNSIYENTNVIIVPNVCNSLARYNIINDTNIVCDLFLKENKKYIDLINNSESAIHNIR